jgi:hypothetical protein
VVPSIRAEDHWEAGAGEIVPYYYHYDYYYYYYYCY